MKTYLDPEPRKHSEWCNDLGLICQGTGCNTNQVLTYDEFCYLPETKLTKTRETSLYGFWQQYGDICGEVRIVKEWLESMNWEIVEPLTQQDFKDLNLFLGYDEFWEWSSGKISPKDAESSRDSYFKKIMGKLIKLFISR